MPASVIVIGGGLSGLVCARQLIQAGHNVTVLEAQNRPGGRIRTLREQFADHMFCEAGAMNYPNVSVAVAALVAELGVGTAQLDVEPGPTVFYLRGQRIWEAPTGPLVGISGLTATEEKEGLLGLWEEYVGKPSQQLGDPTAAAWSPLPFANLDTMSGSDYLLNVQHASPEAVQLINRSLAGLYGDGVESYSALMLLLFGALWRNVTALFAIKGGIDMLPRTLAQTMTSSIRYSSHVISVTQTGLGAAVNYLKRDVATVLEADYVVCAVPFPLLSQIHFTPALPSMTQEMISSVGNTSVTRIYLQSETRFWDVGGTHGAETIELSLRHGQVMSAFFLPGVRGILEAYLAGPAARQADSMEEAEKVRMFADLVNQSFPQAQDRLEGGHSYSWDNDKWARGAYAFFRTGQLTRYWDYLGKPTGRVHFCGDQTTVWMGWMEGAVTSGLRAAKEVLAAAASNPSKVAGLGSAGR